MPVLFRDHETRSAVDLATTGAARYAAEPTTAVWCVGYAVDDRPVQLWRPGEPVPQAFIDAAANPDWIVVAHNDQFERAIEEYILGPRYGFPVVPIERHRCSMAMALAAALPGALHAASATLDLPVGKDAEGARLMRTMSKPRKGGGWHDDPEKIARLGEYCARDVEVERALYHRLPHLSDAEQALWQLDAGINSRGFFVDTELAEAARKIVQAEQAAIEIEITRITGGAITSINQVAKMAALLRDRGHDVTSVTKQSVKALLARQPDGDIQRLLTLRQEGGRAAARKLDSLLAGADTDQRLRGCFRFHGAATGRWSGARFQPQNLKKPSIADLDGAIGAVRSGDLAKVRAFGPPVAVIGDLSRAMIRAKPEHDLIGADFSAIESRVLAWLADETWKLDTYRKFDSTSYPADEPYCVTASRILKRTVTPDDKAGRQIGKVADLALGYGGGLGAWRRFATSDTRADAEIQRNINDWRRAHPKIVALWKTLEKAAHRCIKTGLPSRLGTVAFEQRDAALLMILPSGRALSYPEAGLTAGRFENTFQIVFRDNAKGSFVERTAWFGTLIENLVQATARDLLAAALLRLEAAGYPIVLHCHDEAVAEVPKGFGGEEEFLRLMTALPDWAAGLPIAAKPWRRECYAESEAKPAIASSPPIPAPTPAPSAWLSTPEVAPSAGLPMSATKASVAPIVQANSEHVPLTDLISDIGADGKIVCPFHADKTPSCHIYDDHFHCFSCGAHGDAVDWLMEVEGLNRAQALKVLNRGGAIVVRRTIQPARDPAQTLQGALAIWEAAKPITGTPATRYLRDVRKIDVGALPSDAAALRFHAHCPFDASLEPCLIALFRDVISDEPAGIHRIALSGDVFDGAKVRRLTLGSWPRPRAIKLFPANGRLLVGEGIETVLSAQPLGLDGPVWAAGNKNNITKFPVVTGVDQLILLVDNDLAGIGAARTCRQRWMATGRAVRWIQPDIAGEDFNDILKRRRASC
jgi:DNA polymerase